MRNRPLLIATAVAALLLAAAPAAQARIRVNKSIAGVQLGMSSQRVFAILGRPARRQKGEEGITTLIYRYHRIHVLLVEEQNNFFDVFSVQTTSPKEKTRAGIGVGSTEKALRRRLHGERCRNFPNGRACIQGGNSGGTATETDYEIGRNHRVTAVRIFAGDF
ncbi:MAG TPA: hypothetical protein VH418_14540 [Solirubrobacteraceae bacterium]|jgi:hypothetical protein